MFYITLWSSAHICFLRFRHPLSTKMASTALSVSEFMKKIRVMQGVINGAKAQKTVHEELIANLEARIAELVARVAELEAENEKLKTSSGIQLSAEDAALWASLNSSSYASAAADDFFVPAPVVSKAVPAPVVSKAAPAPVVSKAASAPVAAAPVPFKADKCCNNILKFGSCSFENCEYAHSAEELSGNDPCKFGVNCAHLSKPNEKGIFCSRSHPVEVEKKRFADIKARFFETDKQRDVKSSQKAAEKQAYIDEQIELGKSIKMCAYVGTKRGCINGFCDFAHCMEDQILCPNLAVSGFEECTFANCIFRHVMSKPEQDLQEAKEAVKQAEIEAKRKADKAEREAKEAAYFEAKQAKLNAAKKIVGFVGLKVEDA